MLSSEGLASSGCCKEERLILTMRRDVNGFTDSAQTLVDILILVAAAIVVMFAGMKVVAFIQRIWRE
jgi:hypothetical protein